VANIYNEFEGVPHEHCYFSSALIRVIWFLFPARYTYSILYLS